MVDAQGLSLFFSYAHADRKLRTRLETHLAQLKRERAVTTWYDGEIIPGEDIDERIKAALEIADIVLLLVSPDFMDSHYCIEKEMRTALERHNRGLTKVIPVILRSVDWNSAPFGKLRALPEDGKPVVEWSHRDRAFKDVAIGIRTAAASLLRHCKDIAALEKTVSNPRYKDDLKALDEKWDLNRVINEETILIVIGSSAVTELLDRPTAEHLRDEIDARGDNSYRRAVVITIGVYESEIKRGNLRTCPIISVGGPGSNELTAKLRSSSSAYEVGPGVHGSFLNEDSTPKVALWGTSAGRTRASVENYIARPEGLAEFLNICWKRKSK